MVLYVVSVTLVTKPEVQEDNIPVTNLIFLLLPKSYPVPQPCLFSLPRLVFLTCLASYSVGSGGPRLQGFQFVMRGQET